MTDNNLADLLEIFPIDNHKIEYQLFFMTCIAGEGFLESDLDEICRINNYDEVDWKKFFSRVSTQQDNESTFLEITNEKEEFQEMNMMQQNKRCPIFLDFYAKTDQVSSHYIPCKIVCDHFYLNQHDISKRLNIQGFFTMTMKYMATLARDVLKTLAEQKGNTTPLDCICANISKSGIWKQDFKIQTKALQKEQKIKLQKNKVQRYKMHQKMVFNRMLNHENLKMYFPKLSYQEHEVTKYICDFCISALSIMMINENYYDSWDFIYEVCEPIANHIKFDLFKDKLLLLKASIAILADDSEVRLPLLFELKDFEETLLQFYQNEDSSVCADYYYLQAKLKMKLVKNYFFNPDQQVEPLNASQSMIYHVISHNPKERLNDSQTLGKDTTAQTMAGQLNQEPSTILPDQSQNVLSANNSNQSSGSQVTPQNMFEHSKPPLSEQIHTLSPNDRTPSKPEQMMQMMGKASSHETNTTIISDKKGFKIGGIENEIYANLKQANKNYKTTEGFANCALSKGKFNLTNIGQTLYFRKLSDNNSSLLEANKKDKSMIVATIDITQVDLKQFEQYFEENKKTLNIAIALQATLRRKNLEAKAHTCMGSLQIMRFDRYFKEQEQKLDKEQLRSYITKAVFHFKKALKLYQQLNDEKKQKKVSNLIQETQEKTCLLSSNMVIFANSFPLVDDNKKQQISIQQEELEIGSLTQQKDKITEVFKDIATQSQIPICMKQEILNKDGIKQILKYKINILHLQSQIALPIDLCIEDEYGKAKYIKNLDILTEFSFQDEQNNFERTYLRADLVVLAMPTSKCQAEEFIKLNVKNVVAFNFESLLKQEKTINIMPTINKYIAKFCRSFYQHILSREDTVFEAFGKAETENEELLAHIIKKFIKQEQVSAMFNKVEIDYIQRSQELKPKIRPILYLTEKESYIFEKQPDNQNKFSNNTNLLMDISQPLPKSNIDSYFQKYVNSYTGRMNIMQEVYEEIQNPNVKILEINGESGIGKTRLALEAAEYLRRRNRFQQGIYYHDMKKVQTIDQFEEITSQYYYLQFNEQKEKDGKQFCLIFDHIEDISHDTDYLDKILISMLEVYTFAKIIVISKEKIFDQKGNVKSLVVSRLNSDETVEFVFANCQLDLADNLIAIIDKKQKDNGNVSSDHSSLKRYLQSHNAIIDCDGNPKALLELCKIFEDKGTTEDVFQLEEEFKEFNNPKVSNNESKPQLHQYMSKTNQNDGPHNPELPPFSREEKKRSKESFPNHFEHHHNLTYDDNDESQPMDSADNFDHLNQLRNTMLEEIEQKTLKTALEKSKREQ